MFCPACGKENPQDRRFCAFCGTNLEIVSRALYNHSLGIFTRIDIALDKLIGRYCERVFKSSPATTSSGRRVSDSWKLLGEALLTLGADFVLFWLMLFLFLPLRLITLFVTTPVRLLLEKANRAKAERSTIDVLTGQNQSELASSWLTDPRPSVVEVETEQFPERQSTKRPGGAS
jgi:hypothetical protein